MALRSPGLTVRGIGTVFGNSDGKTSFRTARALARRVGAVAPPIHKGAASSSAGSTAATTALATALRLEPLTVVALGPLTNIATLLRLHPELAHRIIRIVAVAGRRPGQRLRVGARWWMHVHDMNFNKDVAAFDVVLASGVPLTLVPFEAAARVTIERRHLARLAAGDAAARWLARLSEGWLSFWQTWFRVDGFHPFDGLAVAYLTMPALFTCERLHARVRDETFLGHRYGSVLEVSQSFAEPSQVTYCRRVDRRLADLMIDVLKGRRMKPGDRLR